jgi:4-amino-4-deoxy-L-arabinose transferase-like glycosyltransferase
MLIVLPLLAFYLLYRSFVKKGQEWRVSLLASAVWWGVFLLGITESVSVLHSVSPMPLGAAWTLVCAALFLYSRRIRPAPAEVQEGATNPPAEEEDRSSNWLLAGVGILLFAVGLTAILAPPSTWDAMEYHLPRVTMWMSNHSVAFFSTPDYRQLVFGPWAEYAMMHTIELWGSNRLVNLIEFFSLCGSVLAASLIAQLLGAGRRGQVFAAVACAAIPQGLLEASGAMNGYVEAFWIAATVLFLLLWNRKPRVFFAVTAGCAAGLALATKGTAYVLLPFLVLACWAMGLPETRDRFWKLVPAFALSLLLINLPQYARNYAFDGNPLGLPTPDHFGSVNVRVPRVTMKGILANVLRNASLHFGLRGDHLNQHTEAAFRFCMTHLLHADPDDPGWLWHESFRVNPLSLNEVTAGDLLPALLTLLTMGVLAWKHGRANLAWYALGIVASFVLLSALLRWQMWGGRFQLALFVVAAPLSGTVLELYFRRNLATVVAAALLLGALPYAFANRFRSLVPISSFATVYHGRNLLYFAEEHMNISDEYISTAKEIDRLACRNVAIDAYTPRAMSEITSTLPSWFDYPLFALLGADGVHRSVWYTGVHNLSAKYERDHPHPYSCAVVCLGCAKVGAKWDKYGPLSDHSSTFGSEVVFALKPPASEPSRQPLAGP